MSYRGTGRRPRDEQSRQSDLDWLYGVDENDATRIDPVNPHNRDPLGVLLLSCTDPMANDAHRVRPDSGGRPRVTQRHAHVDVGIPSRSS